MLLSINTVPTIFLEELIRSTSQSISPRWTAIISFENELDAPVGNINVSLSLSLSRAFGDGPVAGVAKWSRYWIMVGMPRVRAQCHKRPAM
ncbi:hypothetical protein TNCV_773191 [Trichonephila clavipes]|nr:hypothetical protein TNCV_773191 [Trichonephila clavipes]